MFQPIAADISCMKLPCMYFEIKWLSDLSFLSYPNSFTSQEGKWEGKTTSILGVEKVGNITPMNLARNVFSYWFNQLVIQNATENAI